jgi:hypothetical protein
MKPVGGHTLARTKDLQAGGRWAVRWRPALGAANHPGVRKKFPDKHRSTDGHLVRSKAEVLIDNWLYMAGIVQAYERRLPIAGTLSEVPASPDRANR